MLLRHGCTHLKGGRSSVLRGTHRRAFRRTPLVALLGRALVEEAHALRYAMLVHTP